MILLFRRGVDLNNVRKCFRISFLSLPGEFDWKVCRPTSDSSRAPSSMQIAVSNFIPLEKFPFREFSVDVNDLPNAEN